MLKWRREKRRERRRKALVRGETAKGNLSNAK